MENNGNRPSTGPPRLRRAKPTSLSATSSAAPAPTTGAAAAATALFSIDTALSASQLEGRMGPRPPPVERQWTKEEVASSPAVDASVHRQLVRRPPTSDTLPRVRYDRPPSSINIGSVAVAPNSPYGRTKPSLDGAPPGSSPLEPLVRGAAVGAWQPGEPVQAFYEADQAWYDARVVKTVPRRTTKRDRRNLMGGMRQTSTVVRFEDGFPGEHVVEHVRKRTLYPLNLGKSVESDAYGRVRYDVEEEEERARGRVMVRKSNTLESLTPDVLSRLHTPGERRDFPFKYSIGKERRSVNGSRRPFMTRVTLDADDDEAQLSLVKRFRDYYFGPKDIVEAAVVSDFKEAVAQRRRAELDQRSAPPRPRTSIPAGRRVPTSWMKSHRRKKMSSMAPKGMKPTKVSSVPGRKHLPNKPHTWKDYVWTHMHNWHFAGTGPGVQAKYVLFFFSFFRFLTCLRFFYSHFFLFFPTFFLPF